MPQTQTMTPLKYLMTNLDITSSEYTKLSIKDRDDLKQYAADEIALTAVVAVEK